MVVSVFSKVDARRSEEVDDFCTDVAAIRDGVNAAADGAFRRIASAIGDILMVVLYCGMEI